MTNEVDSAVRKATILMPADVWALPLPSLLVDEPEDELAVVDMMAHAGDAKKKESKRRRITKKRRAQGVFFFHNRSSKELERKS